VTILFLLKPKFIYLSAYITKTEGRHKTSIFCLLHVCTFTAVARRLRWLAVS